MSGKKHSITLRGMILLIAGMLLLTLASCASQTVQPSDTPSIVSETPALAAEQSSIPQAPWKGGQWASPQSGFTSEQEGWFIGSSDVASGHQENYIYLTHDGGKTWTETGNVNDVWPRVLTCGAFANDKVGFLCFRYDIENFGMIYRTTDGGKTWSQFDLGLVWSLPDNAELCCEVRSISFDGNSGNGTLEYFAKLSGGDPDNGSITTLTTLDFGATWESVSTRPATQLPALTELPAAYSKEDAIADGVYVNIQGSEVYNQETVDSFYTNAFAGLAAFIRTMEYTTEGDPIITDYSFDGKLYTVTTDTSRDKFGGTDSDKITTATYQYLVPFDRSEYGTLETYYLSNEENIYTETSDGGTSLIEGLGRIPSPSDEVKRP